MFRRFNSSAIAGLFSLNANRFKTTHKTPYDRLYESEKELNKIHNGKESGNVNEFYEIYLRKEQKMLRRMLEKAQDDTQDLKDPNSGFNQKR